MTDAKHDRTDRARHGRHARHRPGDRAGARGGRRHRGRHGDDRRGRGEDRRQPRRSRQRGSRHRARRHRWQPRSTRRSPRSRAQFGAVTILVNNAGITRDNLLVRMKDDEWDAIMSTNLKPAYRARQGRAARDDEGALRPHHPDRLGGRLERQSGAGQLRGGQGGADRIHQDRSRRKSAAATSRSTAWRRGSSTPT